jgi:protocatechuate 3,4-dioxygenase beta subunit
VKLFPVVAGAHAPYGRRAFLGAAGALGTGLLFGWPLRPGAQEAVDGIGCVDPSIMTDGFEAPLANCALIPQEIVGPYPLYTVLSNPIYTRRDITEGKPGVPLLLRFKLVDINNACAPITDAGIYLWQCDLEGGYSGYVMPDGTDHTGATFLRGLQYTDCNGEAVFQTIFPGWYVGRTTHLHLQIYLDKLGTITASTQLVFPDAVNQAVYASPLYVSQGQNSSVPTNAQDGSFSDGFARQLIATQGSPAQGYVGRLAIGVAQ